MGVTGLVRRVSAIVPTRDRPQLLRMALASIRALEAPDLQIEILVGDNGSAPETRAVAEEFGARYLDAGRRGGAAAGRNAGLRVATGDYLAFLDDDDVWLPAHLREQLALLDARPDLEAVIAQVISTDSVLRPLGEAWPIDPPGSGDALLRRMLSGFFPQIGTTVARTRVRGLIGEFDEGLIGGQDLDWLLRIARLRKLGYAPVPCVLFRGRPEGSYDALQRRRVHYDRRVFLRHAFPEWKIWGSPRAFSQAYTGTLNHFYQYFVDAALTRSEQGARGPAFGAIIDAFRVFPLRAAYHLLAPRPLRKAFMATILPGAMPPRP